MIGHCRQLRSYIAQRFGSHLNLRMGSLLGVLISLLCSTKDVLCQIHGLLNGCENFEHASIMLSGEKTAY